MEFAAGALLAALLLAAFPAQAQWIGRQTGCRADEIRNNPNRPTVADPADITQFGVLELEYGWDHGWPAKGQTFTDAGGLVKFGLLCNIELRWTNTDFLRQTSPSGTQAGIGDFWIGPQIVLYHQTKRAPSIAFGYAVKIPTANTAKGLGSGRADHQFTLFVSQDLLGFHYDFNASAFLIGRPGGTGSDHNAQFNLAVGHPLYKTLQLQVEFYGNTRLNPSTPGFASALTALVWSITPRLTVDTGWDFGLSHFAPRRRIFAGFTYSIANLYPASR